jgi:hypothetical protein
MNTFSRTTVIVLVLSLLAQCDRYEFPKPPYPRVATNEVTNLSAAGVTLQGTILDVADEPITDHGFVWAFSDFYTIAPFKASLGATEGPGAFSFDVSDGLFADSTYYVKAYVSTKSYTTYGVSVSFRSQGSTGPHIDSFSPSEGKAGDTVTIKGNYFSATTKFVGVKFGTYEAKVVRSDEHTIVCVVPSDIPDPTTTINVTVTGKSASSATPFKLKFPFIGSFAPHSGTFGDVVTLQGENFNIDPSKNIVTFNDVVATVVEGTATTLKVIVPTGVRVKENTLSVANGVQKSTFNESFIISAPIITSLSTVSDYTKAIVVITGDNFNPDRNGDVVMIGNLSAQVYNVTRTTLEFQIPSEGIFKNRSFNIEVQVAGQSVFSQQLFTLKDAWLRKGNMPEGNIGRFGVTGFTLNGKGYQGLGNPNDTKEFWQYTAETDTWKQLATIPGIARTGPVSFAAGDRAYVGLGGDRNFYAYDPQTDSWTSVAAFPQLPPPPGDQPLPIAASVGGKGYVARLTDHDNFLEYDPQTDVWTKKADLPASSFRGWMFTIQDQLYVALPTKLYRFDAANNMWIEKTASNIDGGYTFGYTLNNKAYIRGEDNIYQYDPSTDSWLIIPDKIHAINGTIAFVINGLAYIGATIERDFWEYNPAFE